MVFLIPNRILFYLFCTILPYISLLTLFASNFIANHVNCNSYVSEIDLWRRQIKFDVADKLYLVYTELRLVGSSVISD